MRPRLNKPISKAQVRKELQALAGRHGIVCVVDFPKSLTAEHRRNPRRYAQVGLEEDPIIFEFADQICELPVEYRMGLYIHEIGHVLDPDPAKTEDGADRAGMRAFDCLIVYDHRWPGKGLQTAVR